MKKIIYLITCLLFVTSLSSPFCFAKPNKVLIKTTAENGYYLTVNSKPFLIRGVIYNPTPVCQGYDYEFFNDKAKAWIFDAKQMKKIGINCVRIYSTGDDLAKVKEFVRDMYEKFGIYTIISDWLGLWSYPGVNYSDPQFQKNTKDRVLKIVQELKDEKGILMWVLGNENSYTFSGKICFWTCPEIDKLKDLRQQIEKRAQIYYSFVDELAREIKKIDTNHPVALGNGEESFLELAAKTCSHIDILAVISYRGKKFGNLFNHIKDLFNKPVFISEFGADSYDAYRKTEAQDIQAEYLLSQWENLYAHTVFSANKSGNCIGGAVFEWTDEWWKHNEGYTPDWCVHNTEAGWSNGSYYFDIKAENGLNMNEEWFGIMSLRDSVKNGLNPRVPKKSYYALAKFFKSISKTITVQPLSKKSPKTSRQPN